MEGNEATGKANLFKERTLLSLKMYSNNVIPSVALQLVALICEQT